MLRRILSVTVLIIGILSITINSEVFRECLNAEIGSFLPVAYNCSKAIYCSGIDSTIVDCAEQNPYFSAKDKVCSNDIRVCDERFSSGDQSTAVETTSSTLNPFPPQVETTTGLTILSISTTEVIASAFPNTTDRLSCPLQDDPQRPLYLPHPQSCAQYYLCYHGIPFVMQCPHMLLFDVIQQSCNYAELVNCQLSSISTPPRQCLPHMVMVYPHPKNCNYYYRCEFGYLKVMQCPFGMGWDYEMAICTQLSQTKCYRRAKAYFV